MPALPTWAQVYHPCLPYQPGHRYTIHAWPNNLGTGIPSMPALPTLAQEYHPCLPYQPGHRYNIHTCPTNLGTGIPSMPALPTWAQIKYLIFESYVSSTATM